MPTTLAEWSPRALGYLIDHGPAIIVNIIGRALPTAPWFLVSLAVLGWVVFLAVQLGRGGSTPGMRVMGLRAVSKTTGQPIGGGMGGVRALAHVVDSLTCLVGWLFPLWDRQKQTLADKIVGTLVVTVPKQGYSLTAVSSAYPTTASAPTTGWSTGPGRSTAPGRPTGRLIARKRRWWAPVIALVALVALVAVAANKNNTATPINTVTPYIAKDASFSAVFPTRPTETHTKIVKNGRSLPYLLYESGSKEETIDVFYLSLPDTYSPSLDGLIDGAAAETHGKIVSRTTTTYLGHPAEDAIITVGLGVIHTRVVAVGQDLYILTNVSTSHSISEPHPEYDRLLATFHTL